MAVTAGERRKLASYGIVDINCPPGGTGAHGPRVQAAILRARSQIR